MDARVDREHNGLYYDSLLAALESGGQGDLLAEDIDRANESRLIPRAEAIENMYGAGRFG